eukprot:363692-Chlamydomonas_euryale.AAC.9
MAFHIHLRRVQTTSKQLSPGDAAATAANSCNAHCHSPHGYGLAAASTLKHPYTDAYTVPLNLSACIPAVPPSWLARRPLDLQPGGLSSLLASQLARLPAGPAARGSGNPARSLAG